MALRGLRQDFSTRHPLAKNGPFLEPRGIVLTGHGAMGLPEAVFNEFSQYRGKTCTESSSKLGPIGTGRSVVRCYFCNRGAPLEINIRSKGHFFMSFTLLSPIK